MISPFDTEMMARALALAARGRYTAMPNPCVGCVVVQGETVVGEGWHRRAGEPHAEVHALQAAAEKAKGATLYVTLEPCSHYGRTPPCADQVIAAGVSRVVYAMVDPNPTVSGSGLEKLRQAGVEVEGPLLEAEATQLNRGFVKRHKTGMPWVTVKLATSVDGRTAMASGESQWITGPAARADVQRLRASSSAVITGIGTLVADNPSLTVRAEELGIEDEALCAEIAARQPLRVVVDNQLRTSADAKLLSQPGATLVATVQPVEAASLNAELVTLPAVNGRVDLHALLEVLAERECNQVLVEAGASLAGAFLEAGLVDELVIYMAPVLLGSSGRPLLDLPLEKMAQKVPLKIIESRVIGTDWRITAVPQQRMP